MTTGMPFDVVVIGAGPYGLAAAAHLSAAGLQPHVFGRVMDFWRRQMPAGMYLRSSWRASYISDPRRALTLDDYERAHQLRLPRRVPLECFIEYGQWFQSQAVPEVDDRHVESVEPHSSGFELTLGDGSRVLAQQVVVAAGISPFAHRPARVRYSSTGPCFAFV